MNQTSICLNKATNIGLNSDFENKKYKLIRFKFPPEQILLKSYRSKNQFLEWVRDCNETYLGFPQIIIYQLNNVQNCFSQQFDKFNNKNQRIANHRQTIVGQKWCCQVCHSYFQYIWSDNKQMFTLQKYDRGHAHLYDTFKEYLIEKRIKKNKCITNKIMQSSNNQQEEDSREQFDLETERLSKSIAQSSQYSIILQQKSFTLKQNNIKQKQLNNKQPQNIYQKKLDDSQEDENLNLDQKGKNINKKIQVCGSMNDLAGNKFNTRKKIQNSEYDTAQKKQKRKKKLKYFGSQFQFRQKNENQTFQLENINKIQKQFKKLLPSKNIIWCRQTQSLILYFKPHYFICPLLVHIPVSLPIDVKIDELNQKFIQIYNSYHQFTSEILDLTVVKLIRPNKTLNISNLLSVSAKIIKIECFCFSSLITQCPFTIVYNLINTRDESVYVLNEKETNLQHEHIEQYMVLKDTKYLQLYRELPHCVLPFVMKNNINLQNKISDYYMNEIALRVIRQKFDRNKSILLSLSQKSLRKIFKFGFIAYSQNLQFCNFQQINASKLELLEEDKIANDLILIITPRMQKLFKIYNRLLIIENQKVHQNFSNHKNYSIYVFKGVSYTGTHISLGLALICNVNESKIKLLLDLFMAKHSVIPNMLLVSQSNLLLYDVVHRFFDEYYPQTVIRTRELCIKKHNKLFMNIKTGKIENMLLNLIQIQKKYLELQNHNKFGVNMLKFSGGQLFDYDILLKTNSCFLESGSFIGLDLKIAAHFYNLKPQRADVLNETNIFQAQNKFLQVINSSLKINKKQAQKQIYQVAVQKILKITQVQNLRILMARRPFKVFLLRLLRISNISIQVSNPPHFYIVNSNFNSNIVTINPASKNPLLLCDCRFREKTGIPCQHILKIALIEELNFMDCIDKFWLVDSLAAGQYASDFSLQQIMKSKISPMYAMSQGRKRIFDKLFKQLRRKNMKKSGKVSKLQEQKLEIIIKQKGQYQQKED